MILTIWAGRLPLAAIVWIMAFGNVMLSSANYFSGPYAPRSVLTYLWMAALVFGFFPRWGAYLHGALFAVGFAVVLVLQEGPPELTSAPASTWIISMATVLGVGTFLTWLVERVRRQAVTENESRTRAERVNSELAVVSRHKTEFLAHMSHELRTPLNAVIGFSEVLEDQLFGELNDKQLEYVRDILASGRHLLALINDILDLAKVEAGRMDLDVGMFSAEEAVQSSITQIRERAAAKRHRGRVGRRRGRRDRQRRRAQGAAGAREPALQRGQVHAGRRTGRRVRRAAWTTTSRSSVADTGIGIAPDERDRVFQEFEQASSTFEPTRAQASASRSRAGSSSCTADGSGWRARRVKAASSPSGSRPTPCESDELADDAFPPPDSDVRRRRPRSSPTPTPPSDGSGSHACAR